MYAAIRFAVPAYSSHGHLHLPRVCRALKGWRRMSPQKTRRPLPWDVVAAIAWNLSAKSVGMALNWLLMVDTYMRPSECLLLTTDQILPPTKRWPMLRAAVLLHPDQRGLSSKTGEMNESLIVTRPWLSKALMKYVATRRSKGQLWDFNLVELRKAFLVAARNVGISKWDPCLYMARHTGASLDRLTGALPLTEVQKRGRWRADSSVRRYEKRALVQEVYNSLTDRERKVAYRKAAELEDVLLRRIHAG